MLIILNIFLLFEPVRSFLRYAGREVLHHAYGLRLMQIVRRFPHALFFFSIFHVCLPPRFVRAVGLVPIRGQSPP